jgi:hypothetical protein
VSAIVIGLVIIVALLVLAVPLVLGILEHLP